MLEVAVAGVIIYLVFKLNSVLTTGIKIINESADIADEAVVTYGNGARINLAQVRAEQFDDLTSMEVRPTNKNISDMLKADHKASPKTTSPDQV